MTLDTNVFEETITLNEHQPLELPLTEEDAGFIEQELSGRISISRSVTGNLFTVNSGSSVGVIALPSGIRVECNPKVAIDSVVRMMSVANGIPGLIRPETLPLDQTDQIMEIVARHFADLVTERLRIGLYRKYVDQSDNLPYVRGQIMFREDLVRNAVLRHRVYCEFTEFTIDILENQIIREACHFLSRAALTPETKLCFRSLDQQLAEVGRLSSPISDIGRIHYNRFNHDYEQIHALSKLFLNNSSLSERSGVIESVTWLVNMNQLFEDYVTAVLKKHLQPRATVLDQKSVYLDVDRKVKLIPDVTIERMGQTELVLDCKYKQISPDEFINSDVYQLLAYTTALRVPDGLIAYPKSEISSPGTIQVSGSGPEISQLIIDLDLPTPDMELEEERFARDVERRIGVEPDVNAA